MRKVQLFESFFSKQSFILSINLKKKVQFFESYSKKKDSILCVVFKEKGFNSLRRIQRTRVPFFASYSKNKGSILCVIFEKQDHFFESWNKSGFNSLSQFEKIFASYWKIQFIESCKKVTHMKERFNYLRHFEKKRFQFLESYWKKKKKSLILWVILKDFISLSHIEKRFIKRGSILWVIFLNKKFDSLSLFFFFDTRFNSLRHIEKFNYLTLFEKNWVISEKKRFNFWVVLEGRFNSLIRIQKKNQFRKKKSYSKN